MQEIHISMQEVKNYFAGRKGSPREVRNADKNAEHIPLYWLKDSCKVFQQSLVSFDPSFFSQVASVEVRV